MKCFSIEIEIRALRDSSGPLSQRMLQSLPKTSFKLQRSLNESCLLTKFVKISHSIQNSQTPYTRGLSTRNLISLSSRLKILERSETRNWTETSRNYWKVQTSPNGNFANVKSKWLLISQFVANRLVKTGKSTTERRERRTNEDNAIIVIVAFRDNRTRYSQRLGRQMTSISCLLLVFQRELSNLIHERLHRSRLYQLFFLVGWNTVEEECRPRKCASEATARKESPEESYAATRRAIFPDALPVFAVLFVQCNDV